MPRGRKRVVEATSAQIKEEIAEIDNRLEEISEEAKDLKQQKKELSKDLVVAEAREAEEAAKKEMEELASFMKQSGLTVEALKKMINADSQE